jgi:hypothetical protein
LKGAVLVLGLAACGGIPLRRDLSKVPPQQVVYDDTCGVQPYHDALVLGRGLAPRVVQASELNISDGSNRHPGGTTRFAFEGDFQLAELRRLLDANWSKLPPAVMTAPRLDLEVAWSERAGVRRVVTVQDAALFVGEARHALPYNVCLSELLFGAPLYRTRREVLGLPALTPALPDPGVARASVATPPAAAPPPKAGP